MSLLKILFTHPQPQKNEIDIISQLMLSNNIDILHLRRYEASENQLRDFILHLPQQLYERIRIHSHFNLAKEFNLRGIHINSHFSLPKQKIDTLPPRYLSKSTHTLLEACNAIQNDITGVYEYITLSPIYNSISKHGYERQFSLEELKENLPERCIALGGVTPDNFLELEETGFVGAAMLGYIWNDNK